MVHFSFSHSLIFPLTDNIDLISLKGFQLYTRTVDHWFAFMIWCCQIYLAVEMGLIFNNKSAAGPRTKWCCLWRYFVQTVLWSVWLYLSRRTFWAKGEHTLAKMCQRKHCNSKFINQYCWICCAVRVPCTQNKQNATTIYFILHQNQCKYLPLMRSCKTFYTQPINLRN